MNEQDRESGESLFRCPFLELRKEIKHFPEGSKDYFVVKFKRRAGIVVVQSERILLVKQYRFLIDGFSWELPGGSAEEGEDEVFAAQRECYEETGVAATVSEKLVCYYPGLDNVDNKTSIYLSRKIDRIDSFEKNPLEVNQIGWFSLEECLTMISSEIILDAMTVAGVLAYDRHKRISELSRKQERAD